MQAGNDADAVNAMLLSILYGSILSVLPVQFVCHVFVFKNEKEQEEDLCLSFFAHATRTLKGKASS